MPSIQEISCDAPTSTVYSFCTLVTNIVQYRAMVDSFELCGFTDSDCEFIYIDNSRENKVDAFSGYNTFLQTAKGLYIVLCHQDLVAIDPRSRLDLILENLLRADPSWGLCGNAGALNHNRVAYRITDPFLGDASVGGPFTVRVMSLDENFIVVRRRANLAKSSELTGFHWYGSDLCVIADVLGWGAYVVDFHVRHKSGGKQDNEYKRIRKAFGRKYRRAFRSRWYYAIGTHTHRPTFLSGAISRLAWTVTLGLPAREFSILTYRRIARNIQKLGRIIVRRR